MKHVFFKFEKYIALTVIIGVVFFLIFIPMMKAGKKASERQAAAKAAQEQQVIQQKVAEEVAEKVATVVAPVEKTASADIAYFNLPTDSADGADELKQASNFLAKLTPENFRQYADEYSEEAFLDEAVSDVKEYNNFTSQTRIELGWVTMGDAFPDLDDAIFSAQVGTIYNLPVKTGFGYHFLYVKESKVENGIEYRNVEQIVLPIGVSTEVVSEIYNEAFDILRGLRKNMVVFETLPKFYPQIHLLGNVTAIKENTQIPKLGTYPELNAKLLKAQVGECFLYYAPKKVVIVRKTGE